MRQPSIGARLSEARQTKRLKQRELAELVGLKTSTYGAYESGHIKPSAELILRLAAVLDVTVEWLITGSGVENSIPISEPTFQATDEISTLKQSVIILEKQLGEKQAMIDKLQAQIDRLLTMLQSQLPGKLRRNQLIGSDALIRHMPLAYPQELRA